ncbi:methyltransferase domain-containing protein [Actinocrinis puniceicyclus]|uniref:Methyltransferase domain-containing protein n=1 Tax=Actinocrinis puniceicyclus TaxID=977794 RepID=A0A8J7WS59_9ACTN|nr:class I SAM-dependent methyltransferase [Actinocrinis puniceicyclus]MBS2964339.1 methyltransferase domain-containing protein [Actinocrinis puniceicyclus]
MAERSKFDTVAANYAAGRPDYPAELYDMLETVVGGPLAGLAVVDLGAGTGIASRQLARRGALVTALELSGPMIEHLAASSPGVRAVRGSATALPLRDDCADLVTSAQAWHWMDPALAVPELRRVLRPGGVFAAWWNHTHRESEWEQQQQERIEAAAGPDWRAASSPFAQRGGELGPDFDLPVSVHEFTWQRTIALERHLHNLVSKSYVAELANREEFLATERAILGERFPGGFVTERFGTHMVTVVVPGDA